MPLVAVVEPASVVEVASVVCVVDSAAVVVDEAAAVVDVASVEEGVAVVETSVDDGWAVVVVEVAFSACWANPPALSPWGVELG